MKKLLFIISLLTLSISNIVNAQNCFSSGFTTASFATGGSSTYKQDVLWLTWGATSAADTYGKHGQDLPVGSKSLASIPLSDGRVLCIEATITSISNRKKNLIGTSFTNTWENVTNKTLKSYAPGNYPGDSMDDLYNIGGTDTNNKLVNGIANYTDNAEIKFKVVCKATIGGIPVRLNGMVVGDAESLASNERFSVEASGTWSLVELKKNLAAGSYNLKKTNSGASQTLSFEGGNDNNTGGVAFLAFNESAFSGADHAVSFDVFLKGGGITALALGLLPPSVDGGDAPKSYGDPLHLIESVTVKNDNIPLDKTFNVNTASYQPGGLQPVDTGFLGTTPPDADAQANYSRKSNADDLSGTAGPNEEDAWPDNVKRISYKVYSVVGKKITATIPYKSSRDGYISGWIDFNLNGKFDDSERVTVSAPKNNTSVILEWTVPANRVVKNTYARLRFGYNAAEIESPVGSAAGGEVEDHRVIILTSAKSNPSSPSKIK